jgi:hypothetical protein
VTEANHGGYVDWPQISGLHSGNSGGARLVYLAAGSSACTLCSPGGYGNSTGGFRFARTGVLVSFRFCACVLTTQKQVSPKSAWPVTAVAPQTCSCAQICFFNVFAANHILQALRLRLLAVFARQEPTQLARVRGILYSVDH